MNLINKPDRVAQMEIHKYYKNLHNGSFLMTYIRDKCFKLAFYNRITIKHLNIMDAIERKQIKQSEVKSTYQKINKQKVFTKPNDFGLKISAPSEKINFTKNKIIPKKEELPSDYMKKDLKLIEDSTQKAKRKQRSRDFYAKRKVGERSVKNPKYMKDLTKDVRLYIHNNTHKCPCHKLRYNGIVLSPINNKYSIFCDRRRNPETTTIDLNSKCTRCTQGNIYEVNRDHCECYITLCKWCKFQQYTIDNTSKEYCHCGYVNNTDDISKWLKLHVKTKPKAWGNQQSMKDFLNDIKPKTELNTISEEDFPKLSLHGATVSAMHTISTTVITSVQTFLTKVKSMFIEIGKIISEKLMSVAKDSISFIVFEKMTKFYHTIENIVSKFVDAIDANSLPTFYLIYDILTGSYTKYKFMAILPFIYKHLGKLDEHTNNLFIWLGNLLFDDDNEVSYDLSQPERVKLNSGKDKYKSCISSFCKLFNFNITNYKYFLGYIRDFNTIFSGTRNLASIFMKFLSFFPKLFCSLVKSMDPREILRQETKDKSSPFYHILRTAIAISIAKAERDYIKANKLRELYDEEKIKLMKYIEEQDIPLYGDVQRFIRQLDQTIRVPYKSKFDNEEPFIIRIVGDSGVGKSTLAEAFLTALEGEAPQTIKQCTFYRNALNEHWDGKIPNHKYVIYDDFNQDREEVDLRELILLGSKGVMYGNFSSVDPEEQDLMGMKGDTVMFKAVVLCSNTIEIKANTLNSNVAINRRKHIIIRATFTDQKDMVPKKDWSHIRFAILDNQTYEPIAGTIGIGINGIKMMQNAIHKTYKRHQEKMVDLQQNVDNLAFKIENYDQHTITPTTSTPTHFAVTANSIDRLNLHMGDPDEIELMNDESLHTVKSKCNCNVCRDSLVTSIMNSLLKTGKSAIFKAFNFMGEIIKSLIPSIVGLTVAIAGIIGTIKAFNFFFKDDFEAHSGENKNQAQKVHVKLGGLHSDQSVSFLKRNVAKISIYTGEKWLTVNCFFVKGAVAMINEHLFWAQNDVDEYLQEGSPIMLNFPDEAPIRTNFELKRMKKFDNIDDLVLYDFSPVVQARPTILKHFWKGDLNLTNRDVVTYQNTTTKIETYFGKVLKDNYVVSYDRKIKGQMKTIVMHRSAMVSLPSNQGDCGSPVIVLDGMPGCEKIIGINTGVVKSGSMCRLINQQEIDATLRKFEIVYERAELNSGWTIPTQSEIDESGLSGTQLYIHAVSNRKIVPPIKSKIIESTLHDMITPHTTKPVILNMRDKRLKENTYLQNMRKYGFPSKKFECKWQEAVDSVIEDINATPTTCLNRVLTISEAINGVPGYPYITPLEMTTSPAYPFVLQGINGEKRKLFIGEPGSYLPGSQLQQCIDEIINRISQGVLPDYPFMNTIKDERKNIEDVDNGKSRMFSMSSVALTIVQRMYCLPTIAHVYQTRPSTFISIGINKASIEWHQMIEYLQECGDAFFDMDYKKFDTTAQIDIRMACNKLFEREWMTQEQKFLTRILLAYDAQPLHQWDKYIIAIPSGTSSGSFITAVIGSLINESYIRTVWLNVMKPPMNDIYWYKKCVRTKNYGDDIVMTISREVLDHFNPLVIKQFLEPYGINITPGDKGEVFEEKNVRTFTFLKNNTSVLQGKYVPLQQNPTEPLNWIKKGLKAEPPETATEANCNSVLRALFFYGRLKFNQVRSEILKYKNYNLISYTALLEEWCQYGTISDPDGTFTFSQSNQSTQSFINEIMQRDAERQSSETSDGFVDVDMEELSQTSIECIMENMNLHSGEVTDIEDIVSCRPKAIIPPIVTKVFSCIPFELESKIDGRKFEVYFDSLVTSPSIGLTEPTKDLPQMVLVEGKSAMKLYNAMKSGELLVYDPCKKWPCIRGMHLSKFFSNPPQEWQYNCKHRERICIALEEFLAEKVELHSGVAKTTTETKTDAKTAVTATEDKTGNLDQPAAIITSKEGAALANQKEPIKKTRIEGRSVAQINRAMAYNPDKSWTLAKMLDRWALAETLAWPATAGPGTILSAVDVLVDLITAQISSVPFQRYNLERHKNIVINMQTIGYRYARGRVLVYFIPTQRPKVAVNLTQETIQKAILLEAKSLDPAAATVAQLTIPFTFIKQFMDLVNGDVLGQLIFMVQNQLVPGTSGPNTVDIKYLFSVEEPMFKQPRPGASSIAQELATHQIQGTTGLPRMELHSGFFGNLGDEIDEFVEDLSPEHLVEDFIGNVLDAPQLGEQIPPIVNKEVQYFNNSKNLNYTDVLTLKPDAQQLVDNDVFSTSVPEMKISELIKKKANFIKTVTWKATDPVGKVLWSTNVGPMADMPQPAPAGLFALQLLSYISSFFTFWNGSIVYFVEAVSTQFHEGKFDFCFHPQMSASASDTLTYKSRMSQYFTTCHVRNGGNVFGFRAIYPGDSPVKRVWNGKQLSDAPGGAYRFQDYFNGSVSLVVSTTLNAPETVQPDIELNIYCIAAKDYQLFMNSLVGSSIVPQDYPIGEEIIDRKKQQVEFYYGHEKVKLHGGDEKPIHEKASTAIDRNSNWHEMYSTTLGSGECFISDVKNSHFGETFDSLADLCKRYSPIVRGSSSVDIASLPSDVQQGRRPINSQYTISATTLQTQAYFAKVARLFRNFRGAMVAKQKVEISLWNENTRTPVPFTGFVTPVPDVVTTPTSDLALDISHSQPRGYFSDKQVAEVKVPFLTNRTSILVEQPFDTPASQYTQWDFNEINMVSEIYVSFPPGVTGTLLIDVTVLAALADEALFGVFIGSPLVSLIKSTANPLLTPSPDSWQISPAFNSKLQQQQQQQQQTQGNGSESVHPPANRRR